MYQLWFERQCLGYYGTGEMFRRWDNTANSSCPNCGVWKENADHLKGCPNKDRWLMLIKCMKDIKEWMVDNHTYPKLIECWVPKYLLQQGRENCMDLGEMSQMMRKVSVAQDKIGWRHFTEGKIARPIIDLQEYYLLS